MMIIGKIHRRMAGSRLLATMALALLAVPAMAEESVITMSTTTSTQSSGLLDVLLPELRKDTGIQVKVIAKGTGAAIRDGMDGNVDVIFVHDRDREDQFVAEGYGTRRHGVMHNDFILLGPASDPAKIKGMTDAAAAMAKIAGAGAVFVSRGDDSGTHAKERELWRKTGLPLDTVSRTLSLEGKEKAIEFVQPKGDWYLSIGQGMGKTLTFANEKLAYTLADRGTYIHYKLGRKEGLDLDILCEGDASLHNPYGVIPVNPRKFPHVKYDLAQRFADWLMSPRGQRVIADYRVLGQPLFFPDAAE